MANDCEQMLNVLRLARDLWGQKHDSPHLNSSYREIVPKATPWGNKTSTEIKTLILRPELCQNKTTLEIRPCWYNYQS